MAARWWRWLSVLSVQAVGQVQGTYKHGGGTCAEPGPYAWRRCMPARLARRVLFAQQVHGMQLHVLFLHLRLSDCNVLQP
jgi:hypothetical protein